MPRFFEIPNKDEHQGYEEALGVIENFLDDPDNSKINKTFGINEPTAVLDLNKTEKDSSDSSIVKLPEEPTDEETDRLKVVGKDSHELKPFIIKAVVALIVIVCALVVARIMAGD